MFRVIRLTNKNLIRFTTLNQTSQAHTAATTTTGGHHHHVFDQKSVYSRIGDREIVGFGRNGEPSYHDAPDCPMPAIRWQADTAELKKLREKAKGDWGNLSLAEKKALYRGDFRITLIEAKSSSNGEWKFVLGGLLAFMGLSIWGYFFLTKYIYSYPKPETTSLEHQARMLERIIAEGQGRVHGISSQWDYEKGDWKKNTKQ